MGDLTFSFLLRCSSQSRGLASSSSSLAMKECWKSGFCFNDIVDGKNPANQLIWVFPKIGGKTPKMDGEHNGKPYCVMDDLGGFPPLFLETSIYGNYYHHLPGF